MAGMTNQNLADWLLAVDRERRIALRLGDHGRAARLDLETAAIAAMLK